GQGHRLSPPAIARQWAKLGVGVLHAARAGQAATAIARQVVALIGDVGAAVVEAVAARVFGDDAPADIDLSVKGEEAAALAAGSGVAGEGAVADAQRAAEVVEAAAAGGGGGTGSGVAREGAVADAHRAVAVLEAAAIGSGVAGEGA